MQYRNKINEFEALQWNGYNKEDAEKLYNFLGGNYQKHCYISHQLVIYPYKNEPITVIRGDYIVKDKTGYFFPIPKEVFETFFEHIEEV